MVLRVDQRQTCDLSHKVAGKGVISPFFSWQPFLSFLFILQTRFPEQPHDQRLK